MVVKNKINTTETKYTAENTKLFHYTGSKAKYKTKFDDLHSKVDIKQVHTYIEAFGGSLASMFHNLSNISADRVIINDINPRLMNLYKQVQENPQEVIEVFTLLENTFQSHIPDMFKGKKRIKNKELREEHAGHLRDFYNSARDFFNTSDFSTSKNAGTLLFLLQHNFNGIYSEAKKTGHYNISFNWNMTKIKIDKIINNLMNLHNFFIENNVIIENLDTSELISKYSNEKNTAIYLDPPYVNSDIGYSSKQTTDYNTVEAHLELLKSCEGFDYVIYSNNHNKAINEKLNHSVSFSRTNGIAQNKQSKSKNEILGLIDNTCIAMPTVYNLINDLKFQNITTIPSVDILLSSNNIMPKVNLYRDTELEAA